MFIVQLMSQTEYIHVNRHSDQERGHNQHSRSPCDPIIIIILTSHTIDHFCLALNLTYVSEIIHCVLFYVWLLSFHLMLVGFFHIVV